MPSPFADALASLARAFEHAGLRWYLFGAQAAILYGAARLTADVDVTAHLGATPVQALTTALLDDHLTGVGKPDTSSTWRGYSSGDADHTKGKGEAPWSVSFFGVIVVL